MNYTITKPSSSCMKKSDQKDAKPPFRNMPSFLVSATILSYYDYAEESATLLRHLSSNS